MVETFSPSRNSVVISSSDGKIENSNASEMFMVIIRIMMDSPMFTTSKISSRGTGRGMIKNRTMTTTARDIALSKIFLTRRSPPAPRIPFRPGSGPVCLILWTKRQIYFTN